MSLGGKTIGFLGSYALIVNNITGPGMLHLAVVFQEAGLVVPVLVFFLVCTSSTGAANLLCDAMARLPGNANIELRKEHSDAFAYYIPGSFSASQVLFFLAIFAQTVSSIVGTAQSMDGLLVLILGRTWAIEIFGGEYGFSLISWSPEQFC